MKKPTSNNLSELPVKIDTLLNCNCFDDYVDIEIVNILSTVNGNRLEHNFSCAPKFFCSKVKMFGVGCSKIKLVVSRVLNFIWWDRQYLR